MYRSIGVLLLLVSCGGDSGPACEEPAAATGSASCPVACTGGCQGNVCTIDCTSGPCLTAIVCPTNYDCAVDCEGVDACDSLVITCPADYGCAVNCRAGVDACGDVRLDCGAGPCSIDCASDTCIGAAVNCGAGACAATCATSPPTVACGTSCDCTPCP